MKKSRYTESQILKEVEAGRLVKEVCPEYGISDATYYNWKAKYGGMEASDIRRLKDLEDENRRLKAMFALKLGTPDPQRYRRKKTVKPAIRRELVDYAREQHGANLRLACRAVGISDSVYRYQPDETRMKRSSPNYLKPLSAILPTDSVSCSKSYVVGVMTGIISVFTGFTASSS